MPISPQQHGLEAYLAPSIWRTLTQVAGQASVLLGGTQSEPASPPRSSRLAGGPPTGSHAPSRRASCTLETIPSLAPQRCGRSSPVQPEAASAPTEEPLAAPAPRGGALLPPPPPRHRRRSGALEGVSLEGVSLEGVSAADAAAAARGAAAVAAAAAAALSSDAGAAQPQA